jgi:hypothetical protein
MATIEPIKVTVNAETFKILKAIADACHDDERVLIELDDGTKVWIGPYVTDSKAAQE